MEYLYDYLLFLAQAITLVVAILVVLGFAASLGARRGEPEKGYLRLTDLNDRLQGYADQLQSALLDKAALKALHKERTTAEKKAQKQAAKAAKAAKKTQPKAAPEVAEADMDAGGSTQRFARGDKKTLFVLDFDGDLQASRVEQLRKEITAVLTVAKAEDEIVLRLESPGGVVHGYGLAASQLHRIREQGIPFTVAVDKVAASGGYMMAAVANRVIAAPFAVLGSIGVVAQVPNVHRLLKKNDVDVDIITAGKYKRTLTVLGENTDEGREKFQADLEDVHDLFKEHIAQYRPDLNLAEVATGETWYGQAAVENKLIDEVCTSDSYLVAACEDASVVEVRWVEQVRPLEKLLGRATELAKSVRSLGKSWMQIH